MVEFMVEFFRAEWERNEKDGKGWAKTEKPTNLEIASKKPLTLAISGFL